jgi:hypothetical protein
VELGQGRSISLIRENGLDFLEQFLALGLMVERL